MLILITYIPLIMYICYMLFLGENQCWSLLGLSALIGAASFIGYMKC